MYKFANHKINKANLSNGAKLINVYAPDLPVSAVAIYVRAGSRFDPKGKEGLAHFLEHLMMGKTKKYPQKVKRLQALESLGITQNAITTNETASYYSFQLHRYTFSALSFLIEGLTKSVINEKDVKDEKEIIINEEIDNRSNPENYIWRLSDKSLWPKSSFGGVYGNKKSMSSIGLKDIIDFKNNFYIPENITFVVLSDKKIVDVKKHLENLYPKSFTLIKKNEDRRGECFLRPELMTIEKRKTDKVEIAVSYKTVGINEYQDNLALGLIREYLTNNWTSRLVEKLRLEKKLVYWVFGETAEFSDTGKISLSFSVNLKKVNEVLKEIFDEIRKIQKNKINNSALNRCKTLFISSIIKNQTNPEALLWHYGWPVALGAEVKTVEEYIRAIEKITLADIRRVAKKYLIKENLSVVLIGPVKRSEIKLK